MVKLLGTTLIDLIWVAQASLASMAAISIQDDANVARHRPLFELIKEPALVNPIKKTQGQRYGRAFVGWLLLGGLVPRVEPGRGSLFFKGQRSRAFVGWAPTGIHLVHPSRRWPPWPNDKRRGSGSCPLQVYVNCCESADIAAKRAIPWAFVPCGLHEPRIIGWPGFFGALHADGHDEGSKCRKDEALRSNERIRGASTPLGRRTHLCLAQPLPKACQGLGEPQSQRAGVPAACLNPPHAAKTL